MTACAAALLGAIPVSLPPDVRLQSEIRAMELAPAVCEAYELEQGVVPLPEFATRLWRERRYRLGFGPVSRAGAVRVAQIMPSTGRKVCPDLGWKTDTLDNVRCGLRVAAIYARVCVRWQEGYRKGYGCKRRTSTRKPGVQARGKANPTSSPSGGAVSIATSSASKQPDT